MTPRPNSIISGQSLMGGNTCVLQQFVFCRRRGTCALTSARRRRRLFAKKKKKNTSILTLIYLRPAERGERYPVQQGGGSWQLSTPIYSVTGHGVVDRRVWYDIDYTYAFMSEYHLHVLKTYSRVTWSYDLFFSFLLFIYQNTYSSFYTHGAFHEELRNYENFNV